MPTRNHASAILRWHESIDKQEGGLAKFQQSATVSTMLFGCRQWLQTNAASSSPEEVTQIERINTELQHWMDQRGLSFTD